MKKVTKAVIPAAGLGTRMLPIARVVPKEVLPVVDRPAMSYLVEEAAKSGITDVLIITGRNKEAIENYFDYSVEYEQKLVEKGKTDVLEIIHSDINLCRVYFIRQKETKGLGHAISCAKSFVGDEPFSVLYGDDLMYNENYPVTKQLIDVYEKYGKAVAGVAKVDPSVIHKYCSLKVDHLENNIYSVSDMIEKPKPEQVFSYFSILGRVLLTPEIFDILEHTAPGAGNEIQLTDAMKVLSQTVGMTAVEYEGKRYDLGSKSGWLSANVEFALKNEELGDDFRKYLKEIVAGL